MKYVIKFFFIFVNSYSQVPPELISYRAIAYHPTSGLRLNNLPIQLKITILNDTTSIFEESHLVTTDDNGAYNIQIGNGVFISGISFGSIDWSVEGKILKIEMDPNGGINYLQVGQTQLLTVPYAFYSKNVLNVPSGTFETVNTVVDLKQYTNYKNNQVIYVKGYYNEGDGGEGFFIYKANGFNTTSEQGEGILPIENDGTIIKPNDINNSPGKWFRQYNGYLNILYFGVVKDIYPPNIIYPFSNSEKIQAAIDYVAMNSIFNKKSGDMTLYFPNGTYFIDKEIVLKSKIDPTGFTDGVKLLGGQATTLMATQSSHFDYMFKLENGPVDRLHIENFILDLQNRDNAGGFHLKAGRNSLGIGGIWYSVFRNIKILHAKGNGIYLEGGEANDVGNGGNYSYQLPNQFLLFENIRIVRENAGVSCLVIKGQLNTTTFLNCTFEVPYTSDPNYQGIGGTNILISSENTNVNSAVISFISCATGGVVSYGAKIENAHNITFNSCWFEDIDISIDVKNCTGISIQNNRFANAAGMGNRNSFIPQGTGRCIYAENSSITVENNYVTVSDPLDKLIDGEQFITGIGNNNVINASNNSFQHIRLSQSIGTVQYVNITTIETYNAAPNTNGIETLGKKLVLISVKPNSKPSENQLNRINSTIAAGETIFIRADQGGIQFNERSSVNEYTGKNINLNGRGILQLANGQAATFIKLDGINGYERCEYQLVSVAD